MGGCIYCFLSYYDRTPDANVNRCRSRYRVAYRFSQITQAEDVFHVNSIFSTFAVPTTFFFKCDISLWWTQCNDSLVSMFYAKNCQRITQPDEPQNFLSFPLVNWHTMHKGRTTTRNDLGTTVTHLTVRFVDENKDNLTQVLCAWVRWVRASDAT